MKTNKAYCIITAAGKLAKSLAAPLKKAALSSMLPVATAAMLMTGCTAQISGIYDAEIVYENQFSTPIVLAIWMNAEDEVPAALAEIEAGGEFVFFSERVKTQEFDATPAIAEMIKGEFPGKVEITYADGRSYAYLPRQTDLEKNPCLMDSYTCYHSYKTKITACRFTYTFTYRDYALARNSGGTSGK